MAGAIARTDLFGPDRAASLALEAYRTLHVALRDLPDTVALYPTHGGGSFCATGAPAGQTSTLGDERRTNPYLQTTDLMAFMARALHQSRHPDYYARMTELNRAGVRLAGREVAARARDDTRRSGRRVCPGCDRGRRARGSRFRPGAHPRQPRRPGRRLQRLVGWLVPRKRPIVLTGGSDREHEDAQRQLFRIGYDQVLGALDGGVDAWRASGREVGRFESAEVAELATWILSGERLTVLDVRNEDESGARPRPGRAAVLHVADVPHHAHDWLTTRQSPSTAPPAIGPRSRPAYRPGRPSPCGPRRRSAERLEAAQPHGDHPRIGAVSAHPVPTWGVLATGCAERRSLLYGTTGSSTCEGCSASWWMVTSAGMAGPLTPSGPPVLGLRSNRG